MQKTQTKPKVLLLNPPGKEAYLRDYYCNNISKSSYLHYPMDLLYMTGRLSEGGSYEVSVLDAMVKRHTTRKTLKTISETRPDFLIVLVGSISWDEDRNFLQKVKEQNPDIKIIGTGDVFLDEGEKFIKENNFFDGCVLDFSDNSILNIIEKLSKTGKDPIDNCIYKNNGSGPIAGKVNRLKGEFSIPMPRHEYFPLKEYRYAFSRDFPTAHIMTDFGCAFNCSFCPIRIDNLGFKVDLWMK